MAPERFEWPRDYRVDVYSLACLLYETLTGRKPFVFAELPAMMNAHLHQPPPRVSEHAEWAPQQLDDVVARAMAKRPEDRYPSAGELADAARAALASAPLSADPPLPAPQPDDLTERVPAPQPDGLTERVPAPDGPTVALPRPAPEPVPPPITPRAGAEPASSNERHFRSIGLTESAVRWNRSSTQPPRRRRRWPVVLAVAVVVVAVAGTFGVLTLVRDSAPSAAPPPAQAGSTAPAPTSAPAAPEPFTVTATIQVGRGADDLATSPDGSRVYVVSSGFTVPTTANADQEVVVTETAPAQVSVIDTATGSVTATVPMPDGPGGIAVAPDGARVYVATFSSTIAVIDPTAGAVVGSFPVRGGGSSVALAVSPDGRRVYTTTDERDSITVVDTATGETVAAVRVGDEPVGVAFSPTGVALCPELLLGHRLGDRHRDDGGRRDRAGRRGPLGCHRGDAGRPVRLCRLARVDHRDRHGDEPGDGHDRRGRHRDRRRARRVPRLRGWVRGHCGDRPRREHGDRRRTAPLRLSQAVLPDGSRGYVTTGSDVVSVLALPG